MLVTFWIIFSESLEYYVEKCVHVNLVLFNEKLRAFFLLSTLSARLAVKKVSGDVLRWFQGVMFFPVPLLSDDIFYGRHFSDVFFYLSNNVRIASHGAFFIFLVADRRYTLICAHMQLVLLLW